MSKNHTEEFFTDIIDNSMEQIKKMLGTINVKNSDCFKKEDLKAIKKVVKDEVGYDKVNSMIFDRLREWMIEVTTAAVEGEVENERRLKLMSALGSIYFQQGKYEKCECLWLECFELWRRVLGDNNPITLAAMANMALLYDNMAKFIQSEDLYLKCFELMKQVNGERDLNTITLIEKLPIIIGQKERAISPLDFYYKEINILLDSNKNNCIF